ncbi:MAG: TolC family protein [Bacteroidetes bacterium]|nr:MAG: TolC family protein [Bacteroidota bacterium]
MRIKPIWLLLCITVPMYALAQNQPQENKFTIQNCIEYALKNNYQVKNALNQIKIQEQVNRNITAMAYPQLNASAGTVINPSLPVQVFPNFIAAGTYGVLQAEDVRNGAGQPIIAPSDFGLIQAQFGVKYTASGALNLNWLLFDGQVFVGLQARKTAMDLQSSNYEITEQMIKANIVKVYYQLVAGKKQMNIIDANIDRTNKLLSDTKAFYTNGFTEKLNVDRAEIQLANMLTMRQQTQNTIDNGYYGLKLLMGMPMQEKLVLTDTITDDQLKASLLDSIQFDFKDRPEYKTASLGKKLNEYNIKRYKYTYLPQANLSGVYAKQALRNKFDFFGRGDWFTISNISVGLNIPIFDGFARASNVRKAEFELKQTNDQIDNLVNTFNQEVITSKNNYNNAIFTLDLQKKNMKLAEDVYNQTKKKYESGLASSTDIVNVQADLIAAQNSYINAVYSAIIAKVDFLRASGKLPY